jgi:hypothetical protein
MADGGRLRFDHPPHLPPIAAAPILDYYDPEIKRVVDAYRLEAPVDARGVVDIFETVRLALSLVDDEYIWPRNEPLADDIHHFVWERDKYHPRHFGGSQIPRDYRDKISFHKGYLPRQLHEFMHAVIAPPSVPDFTVMEARVRDFTIAFELFESARGVVTSRHRPRRIAGVPVSPDTGKVLLNEEILNQILDNFHGYFVNSRANIGAENEFVTVENLYDQSPESIATELGKVAARSAINLMPIVYRNKRRFKVAA